MSLKHNYKGTQGTLGEGEERARFQARLLDALGQAVIATDLQGEVIYWNRAAEELYGWSQEEALGRTIMEITPSEEMVGRAEEIMSGLLAGRSWSGEFEVRRKDGTTFPVMVTNAPVHDEQGNLVAVLGVSADITERRVAEEGVKESETFLRQLLRNLPNGSVNVFDRDLRYLFAEGRGLEEAGLAPEMLVGRTIGEVFGEEGLGLVEGHFRRAFSREEVRFELPVGELVYEMNAAPLGTDEGGEVRTIIAVAQDITERKQAQNAQARLAAIVESSDYAVMGMTLAGTVDSWNPGSEKLFGYTAEEMVGRHISILIPPERQNELTGAMERMAWGERVEYFETVRMTKEGRRVDVGLAVSPVCDPAGNVVGTSAIVRDISERKVAEQRLAEAEERYRTLVERIPVVTYIQEHSSPGRTTYLSPQYESIKGYPIEEALSEPGHWLKILHPDDRERVLAEDERTDRTGEPFVVEYRQIARDGSVVWVRDEATLVHNEEGEPLYWLGIQTDVTERKTLEERLEYQAFHDSLTGLPNRQLLVDRLGHALRRTGRKKGHRTAILFMDLNNFKSVNDSLGHEVGDLLLVAMAARLNGCLRPEDTLARIGGDEFVVLLEDTEGPDEPVRVAQRIIDVLTNPFLLDGKELYAPVSVGIAMGETRTADPSDLLRDADIAMYRAKDEGSGYKVFDPAMHEQALGRLDLENDLRHALEREEFTVYYQPKFRLGQTDRIEGFEALLRWEHPQRGFTLPTEFLRLAEEMGLIIPIGGWVMKEACRQAKEWQELHPSEPPLTMCVNLSATQVRRPGLLQEVRSALQESGLEPDSLILEITEGTLLKDTQVIGSVFKELKVLGVRLAIDDFGKEYSSLSYLNRLPVDTLKMDRLLLESFGENPSSLIIVQAVISLAHSLGLEVTGEGVESAEQLELLREMGCNFAQGYYLARPLPSEEVEQLLVNRTTS